jgi:hypothetical protein
MHYFCCTKLGPSGRSLVLYGALRCRAVFYGALRFCAVFCGAVRCCSVVGPSVGPCVVRWLYGVGTVRSAQGRRPRAEMTKSPSASRCASRYNCTHKTTHARERRFVRCALWSSENIWGQPIFLFVLHMPLPKASLCAFLKCEWTAMIPL